MVFVHAWPQKEAAPFWRQEEQEGASASPFDDPIKRRDRCAVRGTIKSTDEIDGLFKTAQRIHTDNIVALIQRKDTKRGSCGRVAFIAGKKLGNAPTRNRIKRRMREASWHLKAPWPGFDVVFVAKSSAGNKGFEELKEDIEAIRQALIKASDQANE